MIEIPGFAARWHRTAIYDIVRKRTAATRGRAVHLEYVSHFSLQDAPSALGERWTAFVALVGARVADTWWTRVMAAAATSGTPGVIRDGRESFGPRTLWREGDAVSAEEGVRVYEALLQSGLAREIPGLAAAEATRVLEEIAAAEATRPAAGKAARRAGKRAARPTAGPADRQAAAPPAEQAAGPAADPPAHPAAGPASPTGGPSGGPVVVVVAGGTTAPPLPSPPGGEGGRPEGPPERPPEVEPLTAGERAVAQVLQIALGNVRLRVETPEEAVERKRAAEFAAQAGHPDQAAAKARHAELVAAERTRREKARQDLIGADPAAARLWIERLRGEDAVAIRCASVFKAARADARDRDRAVKKRQTGPLSTGIARMVRELRRLGEAGGEIGLEAHRLAQSDLHDIVWEQQVRALFARDAAARVPEPAGSGA